MTVEIQRLMSVIEGLADEFHTAVYAERDLERALAVLTEDCELSHVPFGTGADGTAALRKYLAEDVLPHLPDDLTFRRVTRTCDQRRVVNEALVTFTHDRELPWLLPGIAPTSRPVEALAISVVSVKHRSSMGRTSSWIRSHRTLWDVAAVLTAIGQAPAALAGRI